MGCGERASVRRAKVNDWWSSELVARLMRASLSGRAE